MIRLLVILLALASSQVSADQIDLNGSYVHTGNACEGTRVTISNTKLNMGHIQCTFTRITNVNSMNAQLRDAACFVEDVPQRTRFFLGLNLDNLILWSPDFGLEVLDVCTAS